MKLVMTITNAVQGCRDLDTMEMALVFRIILHDSHINEDGSDFGAVMRHIKNCKCCLQCTYMQCIGHCGIEMQEIKKEFNFSLSIRKE